MQSSAVVQPRYPMYVANKAVHDTSQWLTVHDKYSLEPLSQVPLGNAQLLDAAIAAAAAAQPQCATLRPFERKAVLLSVAAAVRARADEFAAVLAAEAGKAIVHARVEVSRAIDVFEIAAEEAVRVDGAWQSMEVAPQGKGFEAVLRRFPIGVVSMVTPFNFPLNLVAHKVAPAIASGCAFVVKPASATPLSALLLGQVLAEQQLLPSGAFSIVPCSREAAGAFTSDERFKLLSFTGSPDVGWAMKAAAGKKKVTLELGGNAPCIVDDLHQGVEHIAQRIAMGAFATAGQSCISVSRVLVRQEHYAVVRKALLEHVATLKVGDPSDEATFVGPLISRADAKRVIEWTDEAVQNGAKVACGGERNGSLVTPTIIENAPRDAKVSCDEVFGPLMTLEAYETFEDALRMANDSRFGLQAGVFTSNIHKADRAFEALEFGGVVINDIPSVRVDSQPYGGVKDSGFGREGLKAAIEDMSELRIQLKNRRTGKTEN